MPADLQSILKIEVPVIVQISSNNMTVSEVLELTPGAIIELPKNADDELEILVQNKDVGLGRAVKVGENFGVKVTFVGDVRERINALGGDSSAADSGMDELDAEALAEQLLAGQ